VSSQLQDELRETKEMLEELQVEYAGERFTDDAKSKWNELNARHDELVEALEEHTLREDRLRELADEPETREPISMPHTRRPSAVTGDAIYDLSSIQRDWTDPTVEGRQLRDRAKRSIEESDFPYRGEYGRSTYRSEEGIQGSVEDLVMSHDTREGTIARRILVTGSPLYRRAWGKHLLGEFLTQHENAVLAQGTERALSLTTTAGGFAVPYTLDPTVIRVSNLAVNPFRGIARVIPVPTDDWKGVTSAGITAAFGTEAAAATDSAPALAQPAIST